MMQRWWMHFPLCPWGWRQGVAPAIALHINSTWRGKPPFVIFALAVAIAIAIVVAIFVVLVDSGAIAVAVARRRCSRRWPLPLRLLSTIAAAVSVALLPAIPVAIAVALAGGHCCLCHHRPSQLPSPLAITITVAVGHFRELLPWRCKNCIWPIEAKNDYLNIFCLDSGRRIDLSRMTDQMSSGDGQHQHWAASGEQWASSEESGWQQGGSSGAAGMETLVDHGRCCYVVCWGISHWQMGFVMMCWIW